MPEHGNAHDSGDCRPGCPHPDHVYDGDLDDLDLDALLKHRLAAFRAKRAEEIAAYDVSCWPFDDGLVWDDDEGPVAL